MPLPSYEDLTSEEKLPSYDELAGISKSELPAYDEIVGEEAQKATMGAVQALDVMAAPRGLDWSDANEQLDFQRYQEANALEAQAREKLRSGQGTEPEAMALFRQADEQRKNISPFSSFGKARAISQSDAAAQAERDALGERQTPGEFLGQLLGPGITAETQPITSNVARNIGPAIGGAVGGATFGGPFGGALGFGMGLVGGLMGAQVGGAGQEAVLQSTETLQETQARQERAAEESAASPIGSQIGAMASNAPFFRPSISNLAAAFSGNREALRNVGIAAGIGAGVEAAVRGRELTMGDLATGALSNAIMSEPTKLGRMLFSHPGSMAKQIVDGPAPAVELTSGMTNRGTTSTADVFANVPRRTQLPESNAQQISEPSTPDGGVRTPEVPSQNEPLPTPEGGEGIQSSRQGEPLAETAPEAPREVAPSTPEETPPASAVVEEAGRALPAPQGGEEATGIRNAIVDENRRLAGLPEREKPLARSFPAIHEEAKAALTKDPEMGGRLVKELTEQIRPLTDTEDAVLTFEQNTREQARTEAVDAVNKATTPEEREAAQLRLAEADNKLFEIYQVGQLAGTENARGLNARRLMQNRDFTLAKMLNEKRAFQNDGEPLTAAQTEEVTKAHERIKELETRIADLESKNGASEAQMEYRRLLRETTKEAKSAGKAREPQADFLTRMRESAKQRIAARRGRLNVTIDPLNIAGLVDEAIVGATYVAEGVRDFAKWSGQMLSEFGERIKPQLQALFQRATTLADDISASYQSGAPETPAAALTKIKPGDKLEQKAVYDLYRAHVNAGKSDFDAATKAVTEDLKTLFPSITERQVMDALSGYGKTTTPSKEKDLVTLREFRSLARLTSQLQDAQNKLAPLKTGPQRDKATARVRELQKQVNAAVKAAGLKTAGPQQIATAHDARVTRLKNAIEETERAIENRKRPDRPDSTPWTPEELALKQQLAEARERLDDVLGEPENDRLRNVLKAVERAEEKIRTGDIDPKTGKFGPDTKAVAEATARLKEANRTLAEMRKAKRLAENPPKTEDQRRLAAMEKQRDELLDRISKGDIEPRTGRPTVDTQEQAKVRNEIAELNKQLGEMRKAARPQRPQDELQYNALQKRILNLSEQIAKGDTEPRTGKPTVDTQRVAQAKAELARLNEQMAQMRKAARPQKPEDQAAYTQLVKSLQAAEARLAAGDLSSAARRKATAETQRVAETRAKLQAVNKQIQELRNSSEELRLERDKRSIQNRIRDLQDRISRGDYSEPPAPREPVLDHEKIDLEYQLAKEKEKWQQGFIQAKRAKRTLGQKIWDSTVETFNLSRQLLTSGDLPPVFRQGLFSIGRPKMAARALADSLKAMVSEKKRFAIDREIANRPNAPLYQRAKLYLAKDAGQTLTQQEEAYMGNWFKELPRWTVVGPFLRASERSYNTFLNKLRADTFDAAVKAYEIGPTETAHLRAVADAINTMTGRAKLPGRALEQGAGALNAFLFAPRFLASRFKLAVGQPLWSGTSKSRKFALEQYARTLAGASLFYGLARMAGADIETDPRSTDFLKIRFGNTRIDPLGGLIQVTNFLTRVVTGESKNAKGKIVDLRSDKKSGQSMGSMIGSFLRTKLNPVTGGAIDIATGKDLTGKPVTPGGLAVRMTVPISFQDIAQTMEEQGVPKGTALWILSLFGAGLQTYGNRR